MKKPKVICSAALIACTLLSLCACGCKHEWQEATCIEAKTCTLCGEFSGDALGHKFTEATCFQPKMCSACGETEGSALPHEFSEATYDTPKTCKNCGQTQGDKLKLSDSCDKVLCAGYDDDNYYELVINQIDSYPDSTFEFGVIKNNEWLVQMSSTCPFIDENGWWKHAKYDNKPGDIYYLSDGCFYYYHSDNGGQGLGVVYKPETNTSFNVRHLTRFSPYTDGYSGKVNYTKIVNDNSEFLSYTPDFVFSYFNMNTGETFAVPFELTNTHNTQKVGLLSDGLFYSLSIGFRDVDYNGFFNLKGEQIIDLTNYDIVDLKDYKFKDGKYTVTCKNNSNVEFDITFDTSGNIVSQEKS